MTPKPWAQKNVACCIILNKVSLGAKNVLAFACVVNSSSRSGTRRAKFGSFSLLTFFGGNSDKYGSRAISRYYLSTEWIGRRHIMGIWSFWGVTNLLLSKHLFNQSHTITYQLILALMTITGASRQKAKYTVKRTCSKNRNPKYYASRYVDHVCGGQITCAYWIIMNDHNHVTDSFACLTLYFV